MHKSIAQVSLLVADYDEALAFYIQKLGFTLLGDTPIDEGKRWVTIGPGDSNGCSLLLVKAASKQEKEAVGKQSGGRVFLFLHTDNFWEDYKRMQKSGVTFIEAPREEAYGTVVVFKDLYGNLWDLIQPA
ncbi:VOC family protein [Pseudozobellia thermophila]|uniref:Catechol 2,3-dioxygenase n=1 Tax=Pseudozobellia thermophila TaxID=192903 RepID=A0A1M6LEB7_9FLAO|nr:VOC family protein [Pseudozobellia thermophila]SHJ69435.1 Catechol 2,3-dioxygenase [Pseudozobellia thermophila]